MTSIFMCSVDKELLREREKYTVFVKDLISQSKWCLGCLGVAWKCVINLFLTHQGPRESSSVVLAGTLQGWQDNMLHVHACFVRDFTRSCEWNGATSYN